MNMTPIQMTMSESKSNCDISPFFFVVVVIVVIDVDNVVVIMSFSRK